MRNERGLTLVELLAVLALVGIISALIIGVFINGIKASNRTTTNQMLQQEANYITEKIRIEYLKPLTGDVVLEIDNDNQIMKIKIEEEDGTKTMETISEGYEYIFVPAPEPATNTVKISRDSESPFNLIIKKNEQSNEQSYEITTKFSKLK